MKYLDNVKFFVKRKSIEMILLKYKIKNYHINRDGTVDVDGNIVLEKILFTKLPLKFGRVTGHFSCSANQLTTLEGAPKEVSGNFRCSYNQLTTLEGAPKEVAGGFYCYNNQLTTLEGAPKVVGGDFVCYNNQLTTLEGAPKVVGGSFYCRNNQLTTLEGAPKRVGGGIYFYDNPLPKKILKNEKYIKDILYWQDEYRIWRSDRTLDEFRFDEMMIDIRNDWKEGNQIK
jgi:hypothetical protein